MVHVEKSDPFKSLDDFLTALRNEGFEASIPIIGRTMEGVISGGTDRNAPPAERAFGGYDGAVNMIPSSERGPCASELIVLCFDKDNLGDRLREMVYSAGIFCRGCNKRVVFLTSKWDQRLFAKHDQDAVECLRLEGVKFVFGLIRSGNISVF